MGSQVLSFPLQEQNEYYTRSVSPNHGNFPYWGNSGDDTSWAEGRSAYN